MKIEKVENLKELNNKLDDTKRCILHFSAEWCKPCKKLHQPLHDELAKIESDDCIYINCDATEHKEILEEYSIKKFPTFLFLEDKNTISKLISSKLNNVMSHIKTHFELEVPFEIVADF